ncbi:MAG: RdgB/HAM1 family non-canonical purine NTP pyrophosphatase [Alphaproteobacteria bacterium]|jgi:XTP/dITP diphosphohydrolase|nr:RdgB/HAM1 family non-canonical purine NTP pyrophosphatase [Alphaproteobacteria bacterium]MDG1415048.1 RdgB/HAM1 family non-canonical purine NTP pyrophosphatase [Alphaproteobacteria bacterium]
MARLFKEPKLVLATHNPGKVVEIAALVKPFGIEVVSAGELDLPEPEETETTFEGNARLKAHAAAKASGLPALADDSGLSVGALDGAPGIYSARWAGPTKDFGIAMDRVRAELGDNPSRDAMFICALTLAWPDGHDETFLGTITGALTFPAKGEHGFGYDPIFVPTGFSQTFGEMDPAKKHAMSHRAHAFEQLVAACFAE